MEASGVQPGSARLVLDCPSCGAACGLQGSGSGKEARQPHGGNHAVDARALARTPWHHERRGAQGTALIESTPARSEAETHHDVQKPFRRYTSSPEELTRDEVERAHLVFAQSGVSRSPVGCLPAGVAPAFSPRHTAVRFTTSMKIIASAAFYPTGAQTSDVLLGESLSLRVPKAEMPKYATSPITAERMRG